MAVLLWWLNGVQHDSYLTASHKDIVSITRNLVYGKNGNAMPFFVLCFAVAASFKLILCGPSGLMIRTVMLSKHAGPGAPCTTLGCEATSCSRAPPGSNLETEEACATTLGRSNLGRRPSLHSATHR